MIRQSKQLQPRRKAMPAQRAPLRRSLAPTLARAGSEAQNVQMQRLLGNLYQILGIEYLLAAQGLDFHEPQTLAAGTRRARDLLRQSVPGWEEDRWLAPDIASAVAILKRNAGHAPA